MDFNFDTGAIYGGLQSLDVTTLPPLGGQAGVLAIIGNGALALPMGTTLEQPASSYAGMFRYNSDASALEYFDSISWKQVSTQVGTVTSVNATSTSSGLTVSGGPITTSGSFTFGLDAGLQALATKTTTGFLVQTGADTFTSVSIVGTSGNITVSDTSGQAGTTTVDLATVSQAATGSFVKVSLDGFGRVVGNTSVTTADITTLVNGTYVNVSGDTMNSGANLIFAAGGEVLGLPAAPSEASAAASKAYVDSVATGLSWKQAVIAGTVANITLSGVQTIDGVSLVAGDRILVKDQTSNVDNGIYIVAASAWVRSLDMDSPTPINEINGAATFIERGTVNANTAWVQIDNVQTIGVDPVQFTQFAGMGTYTAGNGLSLTGNVFSLTSPVSIANGGTALSTAPTSGQLLVGNGTGYSLANLTGSTGLSVTNGAGTISLTNTGVTSVAGTTNQISVDNATGASTFSLPTTLVAPGSLQVSTSLTVSGLTPNSTLYVGPAGLLTSTAALTDGQILVGSTGSAPVATTLSAGTGISVTNTAGTITIATTAGSHVTSFSGGTTGLTPSTASTGDVTLAGTLAIANGGTGLTALGSANQVLGANAAGTASEYKTLSAGTGMSIVNGANVVTFNNTGVTSVGLTAPSIFTVTGSPVTTTGTLDFALNTQVANSVFAGPSSGAAANPTFRSLAYADLPIQLYVENVVTPVTPVASAANAVAIGSGANARIAGQKAYANGSFTTAGDAQHGVYVLRNTTTDSTITQLFLDSVAEQIVMPSNSTFVFDIIVAGRRTDATGGGAGYKFVGIARKDTTSGSVTFVGTPSKTVIGETNVSWDASVAVDTLSGAFIVNVKGESAKTIRWVATVLTTEVTN